MLKVAAAGVFALLVTASPLAYAQTPPPEPSERLKAGDVDVLTEARIDIVKAALKLTPDQEKYWPAVEDAIRTRAKDRQARIAKAEERVEDRRDAGRLEALRDRDPVDFLRRRADTLAQRAADLKKLADAWQPLYQTLGQDQKRRLALLTIYVLREMRSGREQRRLQAFDNEG